MRQSEALGYSGGSNGHGAFSRRIDEWLRSRGLERGFLERESRQADGLARQEHRGGPGERKSRRVKS